MIYEERKNKIIDIRKQDMINEGRKNRTRDKKKKNNT